MVKDNQAKEKEKQTAEEREKYRAEERRNKADAKKKELEADKIAQGDKIKKKEAIKNAAKERRNIIEDSEVAAVELVKASLPVSGQRKTGADEYHVNAVASPTKSERILTMLEKNMAQSADFIAKLSDRFRKSSVACAILFIFHIIICTMFLIYAYDI